MATVNGDRLSETLNVTVRRVQQLVKEGLPQVDRNRYDLGQCYFWYVRYLQKALQRCLDDPDFARSLGTQARRTAEDRFGLDGTARQYLDAYSELKVGPECAA